MADPSLDAPKILSIYLQIAQYPILARQIRRRMREELYRRGVISRERLEAEAREKAVLSQQREGLVDPLMEEDSRLWELRLQQVRDHLTDFYFAYNLPLNLFERIIEELLADRSARHRESGMLFFNPELAPVDLLLRQLKQYESLPEEKRLQSHHHIEEIVVVLIKTVISDQLGFVRVAKNWLTAEDFEFVRNRRIGLGKIGGKAGGMLLAWKILRRAAPHLAEQMSMPRSYFIGADVFYDFLSLNSLEYLNQKYKPLDQIRLEYPRIQEEYIRSRFPEEVADRLRDILAELGNSPLIVRSSSLLEDSVGTAFAGKYASYFCPNQGTPKENLRDLTNAIRRVYASVHGPDALFYRRRMGLLDYDERMAILLQEVQGQPYREYYFPAVAGVAFSYSPIVWNPRLRREEGFCRMVAGMGTRAVDRVPDDYPRLVMLSHPTLRPETTLASIRRYSQKMIDVIDRKKNAFVTLPAADVLGVDYPPLRWLVSLDQGDTVMPLLSLGPQVKSENLILTFENLLQRSGFPALLKSILAVLQQHFGVPVDVEFTVGIETEGVEPKITLHLLQCRSQSAMRNGQKHALPENLNPADILLISTRMVPQGLVRHVDFVGFVNPQAYSHLVEGEERRRVARVIGQINKALEGRSFIFIGPGRWGSSNPLLGVPVTYADIYNAKALIELPDESHGMAPEPSYGTHFFQDLVEAQIYPLAVYPEQAGDLFRREAIDSAADCLREVVPDIPEAALCVKLVHLPREFSGRKMDIVMDGEKGIGFLVDPEIAGE